MEYILDKLLRGRFFVKDCIARVGPEIRVQRIRTHTPSSLRHYVQNG